jgi:hypothetical protein
MGIPSTKEAIVFQIILDDFMEASRTSINHPKSHIFFFNMLFPFQFHISHILGFTRRSLPSKYLGAPLLESVAHNYS